MGANRADGHFPTDAPTDNFQEKGRKRRNVKGHDDAVKSPMIASAWPWQFHHYTIIQGRIRVLGLNLKCFELDPVPYLLPLITREYPPDKFNGVTYRHYC
jgi:hypothetical protein